MRLFRSARSSGPALRAALRSDPGRVRGGNQDACLVDPKLGLFAVADGMGGHPAGDVAARVAIERLPALVRSAHRAAGGAGGGGDGAGQPVEDALGRAVARVNDAVLAEAATSPDLTGMGTTLVLALVIGSAAHLAHVGDSRAYLARTGRLHRLTEDHSYGNVLAASGAVDPEQAARHPFAHSLARAIGRPGVNPTLRRVELATGDRLLLCSDGLTKMLTDTCIGELLAEQPDTETACQSLLDAANDAGGADNITVVLVDVFSIRRGCAADSHG